MTQRASRATKLGATLLAGSVAASFAPVFAGAASADPAPAPSLDEVCVNADDDNPFTDIGGISPAEAADAINCLFDAGLINGTSATTYEPNSPLTRQQGAALIARLARAAADLATDPGSLTALPTSDEDFFDDDNESDLEQDINDLAAVDIVQGVAADEFDPTGPLTRGQFASLINRLQAYLETGDATEDSSFDGEVDENFFDDDEGSVHEDNINALAAVGLFQGTTGGESNVNGANSRSQGALLIARHAAVNFNAGAIEALPGDDDEVRAPDFEVIPDNAIRQTPAQTRQYTVTGLANAPYRVTLVDSRNITVDEAGGVTFVQGTNAAVCMTTPIALPNVASDPLLSRIVNVNGTAVAPAQTVPATTPGTAPITPTNGVLTFTVDNDALETYVPVVYTDNGPAGGCTLLEVDEDGQPLETELFGLGGETLVAEAEAPFGTNLIEVTDVLTSESIFEADDVVTYEYDDNDVYLLDGVPVTVEQFETLLVPGADIQVAYNPDSAGVSTFNVDSVAATAPGAPTVTVVNADGGATANDARITYSRPAGNAGSTSYTLERATVTTPVGGGAPVVGAFAPVASATQAPGAAAGEFVFSDNNVPNGQYQYRIRATDAVTAGTVTSGPSATVTIPGASDVAPPESDAVDIVTSAGLGNTVDAGDVIRITFSEAMAAPAAGDTIRATDADGTVADIINGTNATFALNAAPVTIGATTFPAGQVLTVTITGVPTPAAAGTVTGLQIPAEIVDQSGTTDLAGNPWDILNSGDTTIG